MASIACSASRRSPSPTLPSWVVYAAIGVACGLLAAGFVRYTLWLRAKAIRTPLPAMVCLPMLAGLLVGVVGLSFPEALGAGYRTIDGALHDRSPGRGGQPFPAARRRAGGRQPRATVARPDRGYMALDHPPGPGRNTRGRAHVSGCATGFGAPEIGAIADPGRGNRANPRHLVGTLVLGDVHRACGLPATD